MAEKQKRDLENEVMTAISAFEQILDAMPEDRASLEALSHAYEQIGDHTRAKDYLIRLGDVLLNESDETAACQLLDKLNQYSQEDPRAKDIAVRIVKQMKGRTDQASSDKAAEDLLPSKSTGHTIGVRESFNMADELSFAWNLMESNQLTQEEYSSIVHDLTEMSSSDSDVTISVMHVLEARGYKGLEKIIGYIAESCHAPVIALSSFDLQLDAASMLSVNFMRHRAAVVYELMGSDALVVVMNPFDKQLRKDVETVTGRRCHFFVSHPSEFDKAVEKIIQLIADAKEKEG